MTWLYNGKARFLLHELVKFSGLKRLFRPPMLGCFASTDLCHVILAVAHPLPVLLSHNVVLKLVQLASRIVNLEVMYMDMK